jgi:hypothetical protein
VVGESRLDVDFTLILTAVAFKFILVGMLPKLPYHTCLDLYVSAAIGYLIAMTVLPAAQGIVLKPSSSRVASIGVADST